MDYNAERWLPVVGFPDYEVSDRGRVRSLKKHPTGRPQARGEGGVMKQRRDRKGYMLVFLYRDGKRRLLRSHRLVLEAFFGPCPPGHEADHVDHDPENNRLENLRWLSGEENRARQHHPCGESNGWAKLTENQIREIYTLGAQGLSQRKIAAQLGVSQPQVGKILRGQHWAHLHPQRTGDPSISRP